MAFRSIYSSQLDNNRIREIFVKVKYSKKVSCNNCKDGRIVWLTERKFRCKNCWAIGSLTTKTWLENSKIPLRVWYELIWCFALTHSAHKAGRLLYIDPKLIWQSYQRIRLAILTQSLKERGKFTGIVEIDESYYGGLFKNLRKETRWKYRTEGIAKRGRGAKYRKQPVFGIYKRDGKVYLELITECTKEELEPIIKRKVKRETEVFSDTSTSYRGLVGLGYVHSSVDHGMEIYVDGAIHINGMEGFWGLSKTNMHTYKGIKKKNWILYLKEMQLRYNNRKLDFTKMVEKIIGILMSYRRISFVPY